MEGRRGALGAAIYVRLSTNEASPGRARGERESARPEGKGRCEFGSQHVLLDARSRPCLRVPHSRRRLGDALCTCRGANQTSRIPTCWYTSTKEHHLAHTSPRPPNASSLCADCLSILLRAGHLLVLWRGDRLPAQRRVFVGVRPLALFRHP